MLRNIGMNQSHGTVIRLFRIELTEKYEYVAKTESF